jgi:hypothetical protein
VTGIGAAAGFISCRTRARSGFQWDSLNGINIKDGSKLDCYSVKIQHFPRLAMVFGDWTGEYTTLEA